ncbi:hypothetical protein [Thiorhodovibrio frisius]|uniref:Sulfotransferase family protein n=1 Tax=Thiorhodovibrio frisius TaxID=631362 RepID=H8Z0A2_9GAMM|nr:hypothetical protein [Thiorhodovibrio frisius]EIC22310.1 hypothetical protein Thi970DRAFT_02563 [Thiorhodovibrio frisius]WPL24607.1 hypothetical protein Thiofri_04827 [Thiorhodovibrio frisius]
MKKLKLLFHVGFGKTATTWLQRQIFPNLENCLYLGKKGFNDLMYSREFHHLHYRLFEPLHSLKRYRSRNSESLVENYVAAMEQLIRKRFFLPSSGTVVISNESILGYGGYNAELNLLLLYRVVKKIKERLADDAPEVQVLVVFREQVSFLQSYYAYDYAHQKYQHRNIDRFIEYGLIHHHEDVFGQLWVDEIMELIEDLLPHDQICFLPYEWLKIDPKGFLVQAIGEYVSIEQISSLASAPKENVNRDTRDYNYLRDTSLIRKLFLHTHYYTRYLPGRTQRMVAKELRRLQNQPIMQHLQQPVIKGAIKMNEHQRKAIRALYCESNTRTARKLNRDLGALGYATQETP